MSSKKALIITRNPTRLENREVIAVFDINTSSVGLDILENKHDQCDRVHLTNGEVRELYEKLHSIFK
jgi:hypothetical protein